MDYKSILDALSRNWVEGVDLATNYAEAIGRGAGRMTEDYTAMLVEAMLNPGTTMAGINPLNDNRYQAASQILDAAAARAEKNRGWLSGGENSAGADTAAQNMLSAADRMLPSVTVNDVPISGIFEDPSLRLAVGVLPPVGGGLAGMGRAARNMAGREAAVDTILKGYVTDAPQLAGKRPLGSYMGGKQQGIFAGKNAIENLKKSGETVMTSHGPRTGLQLEKQLEKAEAMRKGQYANGLIWSETGFTFGVDGKPRFEIDDTQSTWDHGADGERNFGDWFQHRELEKAYPGILNRPGYIEPGLRGAAFNPTTGKVTIGELSKDPHSSAIHEMTHVVQENEGFSGGTSDTEVTNMAVRDILDGMQSINTVVRQSGNTPAFTMSSIQQKMQAGKLTSEDISDALVRQKEQLSKTGLDYATINDMMGADLDRIVEGLATVRYPIVKYRRNAGETEARNAQTRWAEAIESNNRNRTVNVRDDGTIDMFAQQLADESYLKRNPPYMTADEPANKQWVEKPSFQVSEKQLIAGENSIRNLINSGDRVLTSHGPKTGVQLASDLESAKEMLKQKRSLSDIWRETGMTPIKGGGWGYEINDVRSVLLNDPKWTQPRTGRLKDYFIHPDFFKAYPEAKGIGVTLNPEQRGGAYSKLNNTIDIGTADDFLEQVRTALHETTHWIQNNEKWPNGTNVNIVKWDAQDVLLTELSKLNYAAMTSGAKETFDMANMNDMISDSRMAPEDIVSAMEEQKQELNKVGVKMGDILNTSPEHQQMIIDALMAVRHPFSLYQRSAGEVQARNVEKRYDMYMDKYNDTDEALYRNVTPLSDASPSWTADFKDSETWTTKGRPFNRASAIKKEIEPSDSFNRPILDPVRDPYYDVWSPTAAEMAAIAEANVAPEHPWLSSVLGTSRAEMADFSKSHFKDPSTYTPPGVNPRGKANEEAQRVMTPENFDRLVEALSTFQLRAPRMAEGMLAWYNSDPLFWWMREMAGPDEAERAFRQTNAFTSPFSAGSAVTTELPRGILARDAYNMGEWNTFKANASKPSQVGWDVPGHIMSPAQIGPVERYINTGQVTGDGPKVPTYHTSFMPSHFPENQTYWPIGDSHFARGAGFADVRGRKSWAGELTGPEMKQFGPFWAEVAQAAGIPSVPGQALNWGGMASQTGVKTPVGMTKVEFFLEEARKLAERENISPHEALSRVMGLNGGRVYGRPNTNGIILDALLGGTGAGIVNSFTGGGDEEEELY